MNTSQDQQAPMPVSPAFTTVQRLLRHENTQVELGITRRVELLKRQAPDLVEAARMVDVEIEYLGVSPIPAGPRYYSGIDTDWVLAPATSADDAVVPRQEAAKLRELQRAGIWMPRIEVAHEVPKDLATGIRSQVPASGQQLAPAEAAELVGPIPAPVEALARGEKMAEHAQQIVAALRRARNLAVGAVTIPAQAAAAVLASVPMDPIVIGSIPALSDQPGAPAAYFMLAKWDW